MSQENVEVVRQLYPTMDMVAVFDDDEVLAATRRGFESLVHPDFETVPDPHAMPMGEPGTRLKRGTTGWSTHGMDGFVNFWRDWLSAWETWILTAVEFIDVDESRVLVMIEVRARSKTHQVDMTLEGGNLMTLRDNKLTRVELFFDRAKALQAAGLSEA